MNLPAAKKNVVLHKPATPESRTSGTGWDPFEVWRTRVLLPRLTEAREEATTPPTPPLRRVHP